MGRKTILELMREGGYSPMGGRPVPLELIYQSNTITHDEYQAEVDRQRRVAQAASNGQAIADMDAEAELLNTRAIRAGVPKRCLDYAIDIRRIEDLNNGVGAYICGAQGSHKTTLACSMLRGWLKDNPFGTARFVRSTTLLGEFKDTYGTREPEELVMSQFATYGLLVIDDLGKEVATEWAVSRLWELLDRRYGECLPTIVTTQHRPDALARHFGGSETALAIVSRLRETCMLMDMGDTDRR